MRLLKIAVENYMKSSISPQLLQNYKNYERATQIFVFLLRKKIKSTTFKNSPPEFYILKFHALQQLFHIIITKNNKWHYIYIKKLCPSHPLKVLSHYLTSINSNAAFPCILQLHNNRCFK
jgi:hypothetical protein